MPAAWLKAVFARAEKNARTRALFVVVVMPAAVTVAEFAVCGVVSATLRGRAL